MTYLETLLLVVHLIVAVVVCGFVLMQHGKGADMGAAFGSGSSGSLFGAAGSANFLSRTTAILATVFFLTSIGLTFFGSIKGKSEVMQEQGVLDRMAPAAAPKTPDVPKPADVPQPSGATPASSVPQPAAGAPAQAAPAPAAPAPAAGAADKKGGNPNEVPK